GERRKRAQVRTTRATLLDDPDGPEVWYVIHESALHATVGGQAVMRAQLERLLELTKTASKLTLQVLPFENGAHAGMDGAFSILTFANLSPLACVEHAISAVWFEKARDLNFLTIAFGRLAAQSLSGPDSTSRIQQILGDLRDDRTDVAQVKPK
ncbi:MAG: DUF5753 domain-containing protein, partial [Actinocatenispora sp.]